MDLKKFFKLNRKSGKKNSSFTKNWSLSNSERRAKYMSKNGYGFVNAAAGFGGPSDVTMFSENINPEFKSFKELDAVYRTNVYAQRIINAPADDMTRKWRTFSGDDPKLIEKRELVEKRFKIAQAFNEVVRYANLYGGAGLLIVLKGTTNWSEPLDLNTIKKGDLVKFQPVFLGDMYTAGGLELDPTSPYFGRPTRYNINNMSGDVHCTRLIVFDGVPLSLYARMQQMGFGDSKLTACMDILQAAQMTYLNIANLIARANVDVIAIKDFATVAAGDPDKLFSMLSEQSSIRNSLKIMAIDSEDEYKRHELSGIGQMSGLLMSYLQMIASTIPMPITKLLGTSPDGFGTGINEIIQYYDEILAKQNNLSDQLLIVDEIIERSEFGRQHEIDYEWLTLYEPDASEKANVDLQRQQTFEGYQRMGVVTDQDIARKLNKDGIFDLSEEFIDSLSEVPSTEEEDEEMQELLDSIKDKKPKQDEK